MRGWSPIFLTSVGLKVGKSWGFSKKCPFRINLQPAIKSLELFNKGWHFYPFSVKEYLNNNIIISEMIFCTNTAPACRQRQVFCLVLAQNLYFQMSILLIKQSLPKNGPFNYVVARTAVLNCIALLC